MARLTPQQLSTLKNHLAANTQTVNIGGTDFAINAIGPADQSDEAANKVRDWYNLLASPTFSSWNPAATRDLVGAAIDASKFTPTDSPPAATNTTQGTNDGLLYQNRALACQLKQANAFFLVSGTLPIDARASGVRKNFKDCLTTVPSGASGANANAGWGTVAAPGATNLSLQRAARNGEKVLGITPTGDGNDGVSALGDTKNPGAAGTDLNGAAIVTLTSQDIKDAWASA
jgi:hypothetical protein